MEQEMIYTTIPKIDTTTAPKVDAELKELLADAAVTNLVIDMKDTFYISSVGLRILLTTQKAMNARKGSLVLRNVKEQVKEIFDVTGFSGFLTVED